MKPLTAAEKAAYDAIKQVATSTRPRDLQLWRMELDGNEVAVIVQRIVRTADATTVGFQPLALILDDATTLRLRSHGGQTPESIPPEGHEGAA